MTRLSLLFMCGRARLQRGSWLMVRGVVGGKSTAAQLRDGLFQPARVSAVEHGELGQQQCPIEALDSLQRVVTGSGEAGPVLALGAESAVCIAGREPR
jgi:hypothetical protein